MKYQEIKNDLLQMFQKAREELPSMVHEIEDKFFIIYRGFKLSLFKEDEYVELLNARSSDFYKFISDNQLKLFLENGFIKECDRLQVQRDYRRVDLLSARIKTCIEKSDAAKWNELKRDRRNIVHRIITLKRKWSH